MGGPNGQIGTESRQATPGWGVVMRGPFTAYGMMSR